MLVAIYLEQNVRGQTLRQIERFPTFGVWAVKAAIRVTAGVLKRVPSTGIINSLCETASGIESLMIGSRGCNYDLTRALLDYLVLDLVLIECCGRDEDAEMTYELEQKISLS